MISFATRARLYIGMCCVSVMGAPALGETPSIEGTWRIAAPLHLFNPEGGRIPFTPEGTKAYRSNQRLRAQGKYGDFDFASARCASPGTARLALTHDPFRISRRPGMLIFDYEWNRVERQVDMGLSTSQTRPTEDEKLVGRSIPIAKGRWEGDTLVLDSTGFNANTLVDGLVPHGTDLKVTERLRLRDPDTLEDRLTFEDPKFFTKPWSTVVTYRRQQDAPFREDVCLDRIVHGPAPL